MVPLARLLSCTTAGCLFVCLTGLVATVRASGNVERMAQVLIDPGDPMHVVVRYGAASAGLLFSTDGGHSFAANCSVAMAPELTLLSRQGSLYDSMLTIDARGQLAIGDSTSLWYGDKSGCTWTKQAALEGKWVSDLALDPSDDTQMLALSITSTGEGENIEARSELVRRSAEGAWSPVAAIKQHVPHQRVYASDLLAAVSTLGSRLYATITTSVGADLSKESVSVVVSVDGGKTWVEHPALPQAMDRLKLLAVDPQQPDRVLAALLRDGAADTLFLSDDQGKSFRDYAEVQALTGVAFDPSGRVYVADVGDGSSVGDEPSGGVFTAAALGQPLARLPSPDDSYAGLDCISYEPQSKKLMVCKGNRLGLLDPESGSFEERTRLDLTESLLQCEGVDIKGLCEPQLNAGSSWCCSQHYPFTPFCGEYDVTRAGNKRVYCGLSGRTQDESIGLGPEKSDAGSAAADAGTRDGGSRDVDDKAPVDAGRDAGKAGRDAGKQATHSDKGCVTASHARSSRFCSGLLTGLVLLGLVLRRAGKRRT